MPEYGYHNESFAATLFIQAGKAQSMAVGDVFFLNPGDSVDEIYSAIKAASGTSNARIGLYICAADKLPQAGSSPVRYIDIPSINTSGGVFGGAITPYVEPAGAGSFCAIVVGAIPGTSNTNLNAAKHPSDVVTSSVCNSGVGAWVRDSEDPDRLAAWAIVTVSPTPNPSISGLAGGNASVQYGDETANVTDFSETIISGYLTPDAGSTQYALLEVTDNLDGTVDYRSPGDAPTSAMDLVLSGASESATLAGVAHTQTHAVQFPAPGTNADDNSFAAGQGGGNNPWFEPPAFPLADTTVTYDLVFKDGVSAITTANIVLDVNDVVEAEEGTPAGTTFQVTFQKIYDDGTTASWTVTLTVGEDGSLEVDSIMGPVFKDIFRPVFREVA
ncbi:hypothetical protein [Hahella sp. HN01]|uniref:hypothetical protein n=1 Tax=Hahella sp. HN01 TaxID=2847262 RepID=UPI001C1F029D|nr:hypothetical protein [Hahella sp. HN01]MBU6954540.1 hypothetical protein [Hahella sp. HN01]